jgi:hypothetical protein
MLIEDDAVVPPAQQPRQYGFPFLDWGAVDFERVEGGRITSSPFQRRPSRSNAGGLPLGENAEAVVLDLVNPTRPGRRLLGRAVQTQFQALQLAL